MSVSFLKSWYLLPSPPPQLSARYRRRGGRVVKHSRVTGWATPEISAGCRATLKATGSHARVRNAKLLLSPHCVRRRPHPTPLSGRVWSSTASTSSSERSRVREIPVRRSHFFFFPTAQFRDFFSSSLLVTGKRKMFWELRFLKKKKGRFFTSKIGWKNY